MGCFAYRAGVRQWQSEYECGAQANEVGLDMILAWGCLRFVGAAVPDVVGFIALPSDTAASGGLNRDDVPLPSGSATID